MIIEVGFTEAGLNNPLSLIPKPNSPYGNTPVVISTYIYDMMCVYIYICIYQGVGPGWGVLMLAEP